MKGHALFYVYVDEHTIEHQYIRDADLSFDSLLTGQEGFVSVRLIVTAPFRKQRHFSQIFGSGSARNIDKMQSIVFLEGLSIENLPATKDTLFSQWALSQPDSSLVTSQLAAPKSIPAWNRGMSDGR